MKMVLGGRIKKVLVKLRKDRVCSRGLSLFGQQ